MTNDRLLPDPKNPKVDDRFDVRFASGTMALVVKSVNLKTVWLTAPFLSNAIPYDRKWFANNAKPTSLYPFIQKIDKK